MQDNILLAQLVNEQTTAELARRSISEFIDYTKRDWIPAAHHRLLCALCDDVLYGRRRRVMISLPPRHSKSEIFSIRFPALYLGRFPERSVIHVSYSAHLSNEFSRQIRSLIRDEARYKKLFPATQLHPDRQRVDDWRTTLGGGFKSVGVGGGLTGHGAHLLILDDIVKEGDERSPEILKQHFEWYASAARTRLAPGGAVVIVMTRWHTRDLIGELRALEQREPTADRWDVIELPALALDENDPLGRMPGEPLWGERFGVDDLRSIQTLSPRYFEALYQQRPIDEMGKLFNREDFRRGSREQVAGAWCFDLALSEKQSADFSTAGRFMYDAQSGELWIEKLQRWRDPYPIVKAEILRLMHEYQDDVFVFPKHILELAAVADLRNSYPAASWRMRQVQMSGDKAERAALFADRVASGRVWVEDTREGQAFINECDQFPAEHDDYVDIGAVAAHYFGFRNEVRIIAGYSDSDAERHELLAREQDYRERSDTIRRLGR